MRSYTMDEIDQMRNDLATTMRPFMVPGRIYTMSGSISDFDTKVELRLQTYLRAGVSPEELRQKANAHIEHEARMAEEFLATKAG